MKKLFLSTVLLVLTTVISFSQTQINLNGLTEGTEQGQNCSSSQTPQQFITTGDINLNDYKIDLRGVNFIIVYDLTGKLIRKSELDNISSSNIKNEILLLYTNKGTFKFLRKRYS